MNDESLMVLRTYQIYSMSSCDGQVSRYNFQLNKEQINSLNKEYNYIDNNKFDANGQFN